MEIVPTVGEADRLARSVLRQRLNVKPGESVTIESYSRSLPWATAFVREARRLGARPLLHYEDEDAYWTAIEEGRASLIGTLSEAEMGALKETDVYVYFWGPEDMARRRKLSESAAEKAVAFNSRWYEVARKTGLRGARMAIARVTEPNARLFGVPYRAWRDEIVTATSQDITPMVKQATRIRQALARGRSVRIRHSNGTDLTLGLVGRPAVEAVGRVTAENLKTAFGMMTSVPDGSVYTAVDEGVAEGTFLANRATTTAGPHRVGGRWRFQNGRLREARYQKGEASFQSGYRAGGPARERPAFIEVGLNPSLHVSPLMEEAELGMISFGVGSNASFGGKSSSPFSEYLSLAGGDLLIDDVPFVRRGRPVAG